MSKLFEGTITIDGITNEVYGQLTKNRIRITGTLVFKTATSFVIPLQLIQRADQVLTNTGFFFSTSNGDVVRVLPIDPVNTLVGDDLSSLTITDCDAELNGDPVLLSINISAIATEISTEGFTEEQAVPNRDSDRRAVGYTRINEIGNLADHFGMILSVPRREGESNEDYVYRIRFAASKKSNSSYQGMINGINRELGLTPEDAIEVSVRPGVSERYNLRFCIDEARVQIYSHWVSLEDQETGLRPILEQEILLTDIQAKTIGDLVDWINTSSLYSAKLISNGEKLSSFITKHDSRKIVVELILAQEINRLSSSNVIPGSLEFKRQSSFDKEIPFSESLASEGEYQVSYGEGIIKSFIHPKESFGISYLTSEETFSLSYSDINILDLQKKPVQEIFFEQISQDVYSTVEESQTNGLPKAEMYGIIRKVLTAGEFNQYWGE